MTDPINRSKISIITVVYNAISSLESTILSVISQKRDFVEFWIIDGGSKDGSIEIIEKYANSLTGWISEPDNGIYDAMNKGIKQSKGEWIYFLGADDTLQPGVIDVIQSSLTLPNKVVYGDVLFDNGHRMRSFLGPRTLLQNTLHHQSAFYHRSNFINFNYDTTLGIIADYELNLRIYTSELPSKYVPIVIATCSTGGASSRLSKSLRETNQVRTRYVENKFLNVILSFSLMTYYAQKKLRSILYGHKI